MKGFRDDIKAQRKAKAKKENIRPELKNLEDVRRYTLLLTSRRLYERGFRVDLPNNEPDWPLIFPMVKG